MLKMMKNRYSIVAIFALLNIACFTCLRLAFVIRSWDDIPHDLASLIGTFGIGLIYDLSFNAYFWIPFVIVLAILPQNVFVKKGMRLFFSILFLMLVYGLIFVLAAEWLFWDEFSVRFNFISVDYLIYRREVTNNIKESYPMPLIISVILILDVLVCLSLRSFIAQWMESDTAFRQRIKIAGVLLGISGLCALSVGQELRSIPENNYLRELRSSGPYQFVAAFKNNALDYDNFYALTNDQAASDHLKAIYNKKPDEGGLFDISRSIKSPSVPQQYNVIMISVESLSGDFMQRFGNQENITPFLDRWADQSLCFDHLYATGTRTTRGLEALTLAIPPTPGRSLVKRPDNHGMYNFGSVLADHGYETCFLYSGYGFFENMNEFFSGCGYRTVDKLDFKDDEVTFSNAWGVCDEDLYRKAISVADEIVAQNKPFFFHIMTTSNHRPYTYPEGKIDIPSGTGRSGAVKYTDYAIKVLIEESSKKPWFDKTIFVVVADHCAGSAGKVGLPIQQYHIPLFMYGPKIIKPKIIDKVCSQIDIAPTVLALLGISYESHFFGKNILDDDFEPRALIGNYQKLALYKNNVLTMLEPVKKAFKLTDPYHNDVLVPLENNSEELLEVQSYYQGANYLLKHDLMFRDKAQ
jgi:phosphoglycerol transferase MdoB-like AlkP superfamily enzyme